MPSPYPLGAMAHRSGPVLNPEKTHDDYFNAANDARDLTFDKDRRKLDGFDEKTGENGRLERPPVG